MSKISTLHTARINKKDEFYTTYEDIEKEMEYHIHSFKGRTIFCNCNDTEQSAFWKYFYNNFDKLRLKELIATEYNPSSHGYKIIFDGKNKVIKNQLNGDGDFRSKECVKLLKETDIIVSNSPFSLFREYINLLTKYDKKYLIIGNVNALTYKEVFPLIKENKLWFGASIHSGDRKFYVPDDYPLNATGCGIENDKKFIKVKGIRWFTNLDYSARHEFLPLTEHYSKEKYLKYDNIDAINIDKSSDIPADYDGIMGVPITFFDKYCPEQFEILGCTANPESNSVEKRPRSDKALALIKQGKIKRAKCVGGNSNICIDENDYVHVVYHRLLIRRR